MYSWYRCLTLMLLYCSSLSVVCAHLLARTSVTSSLDTEIYQLLIKESKGDGGCLWCLRSLPFQWLLLSLNTTLPFHHDMVHLLLQAKMGFKGRHHSECFVQSQLSVHHGSFRGDSQRIHFGKWCMILVVQCDWAKAAMYDNYWPWLNGPVWGSEDKEVFFVQSQVSGANQGPINIVLRLYMYMYAVHSVETLWKPTYSTWNYCSSWCCVRVHVSAW